MSPWKLTLLTKVIVNLTVIIVFQFSVPVLALNNLQTTGSVIPLVKYIFDPTIFQLSLHLLRRYPNPQVGTTLNTFPPAATHQFHVQAFHVLPTTDSRHFVHVRKWFQTILLLLLLSQSLSYVQTDNFFSTHPGIGHWSGRQSISSTLAFTPLDGIVHP